MKHLLLCVWTWVLLVLMASGSMGCLEEERNALLRIKAALNHPNGSSLPDWGEKDGDCCSWYCVVCDNTTLRVTQLNLFRTRKSELPWVIDASLFLPLKELQVLDLSYNYLSGLNGMPNLKKLKVLDLSYNNRERVSSLYKQTSAATQNLSSNQLQGLCGLKNLEELDISNNEFRGPLPSCLCNLTSLRRLNVENNHFSKAIPSCLLSNLNSLEYIDFSGNSFEGSLSLASLANSSNLEKFFLLDNHNHLEVNTEEPTWFPSFQLKAFKLSNCVLNKDTNGVIPSFLREQHDLMDVELNHIGMTGNFPNWLLHNNANLEQFELIGNNLSGAFYLPSNLSLVNMSRFNAQDNFMEGQLPSWIGFILPNLRYLDLSDNLLKGRIPPSIGNMKLLYTLDLSNNGFTGEIPETLAKDCMSLDKLKLSGNNLQGQVLPRNFNLTRLQYLYLDSNNFTWDLSLGILNSSSLLALDVSDNLLSGTLPNWIGDIHSLRGLVLSNNFLEGPLPLSFCNLHSLSVLDLSSNNLGPNISLCGNITVSYLHLANDKLIGHFPEFLSEASSLVTLDLRRNSLSGEIPSWIGSLRKLKVLLLQGNNFEGSIPLNLCLLKNITILDLSNNNLSGKIPPCLKDLTFRDDGEFFPPMKVLSIYNRVTYYREIPFEFEEVNFTIKSRLELYRGLILPLMSGVDLSQNNLTGFIPLEVGHLSELRALNLSHNHLMGPIPKTFSKLKNVESLDLSYNNLIGPIPAQLTELYALSCFSVAHNNLSGRLPDPKNQFGTFDEASYEGNPLLCGRPLTSCDDSNKERGTPPSFNHTKEDDPWREAFLWSFAGSYVVAFLGVTLFLYLNSYCQCVLFAFVCKLIPSFPHSRLFF